MSSWVNRIGKDINSVFLAGSFLLYWRFLKETPVCAREKRYAYKDKKIKKTKSVNLTEHTYTPDESDLRLCQVQVVFRHGARTPIHTLPKHNQATFAPEMCMAPHSATIFPYKRVSTSTGLGVDYGAYQKHLMKAPLKGGAFPGMLTSYGQDQLLMLGRRLKKDYGKTLQLDSFNPQDVHVISTNIQRTVESARCVMSGLFGADHLTKFATESTEPVKIHVADDVDRGLLIPDHHNCTILRQINHAGMKESDKIPEIKEDRLELETHIDTITSPLLKKVEKLEKDLDKLESQLNKEKKPVVKRNKFHQRYVYDSVKQPVLEERNKAAEDIPLFWSDVMCRHPELANSLTSNDMKALIYLKRIEVEELPEPTGPFQATGHRFIFHFHNNPYFYDQSLIKEVYTYKKPNTKTSNVKKYIKPKNLASSWSSNIHWKPNGASAIESKTSEQNSSPKNSFFSWYRSSTKENDQIAKVLREDIYSHPVEYLNLKPVNKAFDHYPFNFVFVRDDCVAREAHGFAVPTACNWNKNAINKNATTMLHNAMVGQDRSHQDAVARLGTGMLLWEITEQCRRQINPEFLPGSKKLILYSAHDSTLCILMSALGIWDDEWPPYGSDIRMELWEDVKTKDFFVKMIYNGKTVRLRNTNRDILPWSTFKSLMMPLSLSKAKFKEACKLDSLDGVMKDYKKLSQAPGEEEEAPAGM